MFDQCRVEGCDDYADACGLCASHLRQMRAAMAYGWQMSEEIALALTRYSMEIGDIRG